MTESIKCEQCGKMIALRLEGELEFYCPRCHHYQKLVASTAMIVMSDSSPDSSRFIGTRKGT